MSKLLFLVFLMPILVFNLVNPQSVKAATITVTQDPIFANSDTITITVKSDEDNFSTSLDYTYRAWKTDRDQVYCPVKNVIKPIDSRTIVASWSITYPSCLHDIGTWQFDLAIGRYVGYKYRIPDSDRIGKPYFFEIQQVGGSNPSISPVKPIYFIGEDTYVNLINARASAVYTFWWESSTVELAIDPYTAPNDGNFEVKLNKTGVDFSRPGTKTLCMEIGSYHSPLNLNCRYKSIPPFNFSLFPPSATNPECRIQPNTPNVEDSVSLIGINLDKNQDFRADLDSTNIPGFKTSGNSGTVQFQLGRSLSLGTHTATLYNTSDQAVCPSMISFNVGEKLSPTAPSTPCTDPAKCTSGAGKSCDSSDPSNPGISTAIGCIHTSPLGFVKDLLTFITAISGGLAFLMMLLGAFQMLRSAGNPDSLSAGRERFKDAVIGLLIVIFAVLLLQIIGVDILGILEK